MRDKHHGSLPKTVAVVMSKIPLIAIKTGWIYLKTKRRVRKRSKYLMKGMLKNGMPKDLARLLADQYEAELSFRKLVEGLGARFSKKSG